MENTNSLGLLLSFARPCRRLLAASVGLAVLGLIIIPMLYVLFQTLTEKVSGPVKVKKAEKQA